MWPTLNMLRLTLSRMVARKASPRRRPAFRRHRLEALEGRNLLSAYLVTTTADSGPGSLRDAINQANADSQALSTIDFSIPGSGVQTISPATDLPVITHPVVINGFSQPGSSANTLPVTGSNAGDNAVRNIILDVH
jgi:hypothetical protein